MDKPSLALLFFGRALESQVELLFVTHARHRELAHDEGMLRWAALREASLDVLVCVRIIRVARSIENRGQWQTLPKFTSFG